MIRSANISSVNRRNVTFAIAAILALGTGWLTFSYLSSINKSAANVVAPRIVVVAARDIPARAVITIDMLTSVRRPGNAVDPDAISTSSAAVGAFARVTMPTGSTVTTSKLGRAIDVGLTTRLHSGMRAMSIPIDRVKGVANLLQAGDHVDVIALTRAEPGFAARSLTILRNKTVLAMGSTFEAATVAAAGASPSPDMQIATATLEVTPKEANELALADMNATLRLALRVPKEPTRSQSVDAFVMRVPPEQVVPKVAPAAQRAVTTPVVTHLGKMTSVPISPVTVIDGDQVLAPK